MDGVYTSNYRRIFLLTTNETHINDNLISRPSRLRYIHEFGNLEQDITREYLNDTLNDKSRIEDIIDFVDTLQRGANITDDNGVWVNTSYGDGEYYATLYVRDEKICGIEIIC